MATTGLRYRIAFFLLTFSLLGQGMAVPFGISSIAVLVMIVGLPILITLAITVPPSTHVRRFTRYNSALFAFFAAFFFVGLISGKIGYPSYLLSIIIHQIYYMICIVLLGPIGIWRSLRIAAWINIAAVAIQIFGGIIGIDELVMLRFLGIDKGSSVERWGFLPRASGLSTEPAHLSYILLPVLLVALFGGREKYSPLRKGRGFFLVCYILTMSVLAYLQLTIALLASNIHRRSFSSIFLSVVAALLLGSALMTIPFARDRIDGMLLLLDSEPTKSSSVFSIQSNTLVTLQSLKDAPFLGNGITSHRVIYEDEIGDIYDFVIDDNWQGLNKNDAGSLPLLLLSETGVVGFTIFVYFVFMAVWRFSRLKGELAVSGLAHALTLGVVGLRYGQFASQFIMLNLQVVLFCLAALRFPPRQTEEVAKTP